MAKFSDQVRTFAESTKRRTERAQAMLVRLTPLVGAETAHRLVHSGSFDPEAETFSKVEDPSIREKLQEAGLLKSDE